MHAHLKNCSQKLKEERSKFFLNLRSIIHATQEKLRKYYDATSSKKNLYFNLDLCFNLCDKLNYYKICHYNRAFNRSLYFFSFISNIIAFLIARSFLCSSFEYNRVFNRSSFFFLSYFEYNRAFNRSFVFFFFMF